MALSDGTPDPSAYGAALSQPGYGYGSPLLLPQVAQAYQNDPKTALVRALLQQNEEGLKSFMPSGRAVAGHVLASGLGALASALQGKRYEEANQGALDTMKEAYAAAQPTPAQTDAQGNVTSPAVPADMRRVGQILMGNAATAGPALANLQTIMAKYQEPTKLGRGDIITTPGTGQVLAANTMPNTSFGQLVQERSQLANANPNDPRIALYDAQIAKGNQDSGIKFGPDGAAPVPGFGQAKAAVEAPAAGAVETAKNPALITRAGGVKTAEITAQTTPTAIAGQAALEGATKRAGATATYPTENALAQNKPQVIEPGYRINIDPNRVVPPGTAPLPMGGGAGPIAPPPSSTPAPGSPAYSASSTVRPDIPPSPPPQNGVPQPGSAATSAAGGSRPGTPPPATPSAPTALSTTPPPPVDLSAITRTQNPGGGITLSSQALPQRVVQPLVEADRKEVGVDREKAIAGQADQANIRMIQDFLPKVQTGWSAESKLEGARILKAAGVPDQWMNDYLKTDVAAGQLLTKQFLTLSMGAARSMGAREPGSVIQMFRGAYPGIGTDPQAINLQSNALYMDRQRTNDMAAAKTNFLGDSVDGYQKSGTYRGLKGFNEDFAKTNAPELYLHAAEAMSGVPQPWIRIKAPDQQQAIINLIPSGTKFLAPDGQMRVKP